MNANEKKISKASEAKTLNTTERKSIILDRLSNSEEPISASVFAGDFSVSRQIIVGDIAVLRAAGNDIIATPRGYIMQSTLHGDQNEFIATLAVKHDTKDMEEELSTIVDYGGIILDVTVEHPIYGQLVGALNISSRYDVQLFMDKIRNNKTKPLSNLTNGIHLHRIKCRDGAAFQLIKEQLKNKGILFE